MFMLLPQFEDVNVNAVANETMSTNVAVTIGE